MQANVKPGTRCECRDVECKACLDGCTPEAAKDVSARRDLFPCHRNAVRPVVIYRPDAEASRIHLCTACADYHESRGVTK